MQTIRSPGAQSRASARVKARVIVVMFGPNQIDSGGAPNSSPTVARALACTSSQAADAAKKPPPHPFSPLAENVAIASMAESTIWVPAGPSKRAQPSWPTPGKRSTHHGGAVWHG